MIQLYMMRVLVRLTGGSFEILIFEIIFAELRIGHHFRRLRRSSTIVFISSYHGTCTRIPIGSHLATDDGQEKQGKSKRIVRLGSRWRLGEEVH